MCNGISKVGSSSIPPTAQQTQPKSGDISKTNPSAGELLDILSKIKMGEIISSTNSTGTACLDLTPNSGGWLIIKMLGDDEAQPSSSSILQKTQTVFENTGIVLGDDTQYVLTNQFSGCSFFMLGIGDEQHVFHINEKPQSETLANKLKPFGIVAQAIINGKQPGQGRDAYFTKLVDDYLTKHSNEAISSLKTSDPAKYREQGVALMVMENMENLSGYVFTERVYNCGKTFEESGQMEKPDAHKASAMLVKDDGHWFMLEQSQRVVEKGELLTSPSVVRGGMHPLNPPNVYTALEDLAKPSGPPPGAIKV